MQIVIDIPDNYKLDKIKNGTIASKIILNTIKNGVILPKGHGRLIDADVTIEKIGNLDGFGFIGKCINEIPTVIEKECEPRICKQCGAPLYGNVCGYCGTRY